LSTKIHALVDALGDPLGFCLTGGEAHDLVGADELLPDMQAETLIADKAYDADERVIDKLTAAGKQAVIPPKANRKVQRTYDQEIYKARHLIENFFAKLKQFRAIATRYDKTARNFLGAIHLIAAIIWLNRPASIDDTPNPRTPTVTGPRAGSAGAPRRRRHGYVRLWRRWRRKSATINSCSRA
jgi:transposase